MSKVEEEQAVVDAFKSAVHTVMDDKAFMQNYDRLKGTQLSKLKSRAPIEIMIDEVTGYQKEHLFEFFDFVKEYVFLPWINSCMQNPMPKK